MNKDILIEKLTSLNIFDTTSTFFVNYVDLILNNLKTKKEKFKTQCHHIIPRYYFKVKGLIVDNTTDNKVNLNFTDHILAHYYLGQCAIDQDFKIGMLLAMQYMGVSESTIESISNVSSAQEMLSWYKEILIAKAARHSEKTKGKMPVPWNKGGNCYTPEQHKKLHDNLVGLHTKYWLGKHLPDEMKSKISTTLLGTHLSDETKQKISMTNKLNGVGVGKANGMYGVRNMTNGVETVQVKAVDIAKYLENGYIFGSLNKIKNLDTQEIYINVTDAASKLNVSTNYIYNILSGKIKKPKYILKKINTNS